MSWCLGNIFPSPLGPGGSVNIELDAVNLERYLLFRAELERATRIWERHSRMNFVHLTGLDDRRRTTGGMCDTALTELWFRAQTEGCTIQFEGHTNAGGENELDPSFASLENPHGSDRLLCIDWRRLEAAKTRVPYLAAHESGHIVGLEHEQVRWDQSPGGELPQAHACRDNYPYEPLPPDQVLTARDPYSVMGADECIGSEKADGPSPLDVLGAYFVFNWAERRATDSAPLTGASGQRQWAGDASPGLLWYLPRPDRLIEWRFDPQQPGPLSFQTIERCLDGESPPCTLSDSGGHWHPVQGQFTGSSSALDLFMYSADEHPDVLLRNQAAQGLESFQSIEAPAPNRAVPVVGNFNKSQVQDQILWYRPGSPSEQLWAFNADGSHEVVNTDVEQSDTRIPLTGHFRSRSDTSDIIWFEPRSATVQTWIFGPNYAVQKSVANSVALLGVTEGTEYVPIVGNFDGDNRTDLFWYSPGPAADWLWLSDSNSVALNFDSYEFAVDGEYHPITGDFDADGDDDLLWYRPASELSGGLSWMWYFDGPQVEVKALEVSGDYLPYVEDFDSDGCTDILWYDPVAPGSQSHVWRCLPQQKTFSCDEHVSPPRPAYPIAFATGGY